jgi:plasmid stabilization system protein ParE
MSREIHLTRKAEADLDSILTWLESRSPSGAVTWLKSLEAAFESLEEHAASYPLAPENDSFAEEIRERLFKTKRGRPYRLLFSLTAKQVQILHIRGPGQDLIRPK